MQILFYFIDRLEIPVYFPLWLRVDALGLAVAPSRIWARPRRCQRSVANGQSMWNRPRSMGFGPRAASTKCVTNCRCQSSATPIPDSASDSGFFCYDYCIREILWNDLKTKGSTIFMRFFIIRTISFIILIRILHH